MSKKISGKKVVELASKIKMEPSEEFINEMKKEFEKNSDGLTGMDAKKEVWPMSKKIILAAGIFCIVLILGTVIKINSGSKTVSADEGYSFVNYDLNSTVEVSGEFAENQNRSSEMHSLFIQSLPYNGKYKAAEATGSYTVDMIGADQFPDYYAGCYINVEGKLIVQIKDSYYKKNYRSCDWYKELEETMKSSDFACHPVKYNYTELVNGMSDITGGKLAEKLKKEGIEMGSENGFAIVGIGLNDYLNCIEIEIRREEMADRIKEIIDDGRYSIVVSGDAVLRDD